MPRRLGALVYWVGCNAKDKRFQIHLLDNVGQVTCWILYDLAVVTCQIDLQQLLHHAMQVAAAAVAFHSVIPKGSLEAMGDGWRTRALSAPTEPARSSRLARA